MVIVYICRLLTHAFVRLHPVTLPERYTFSMDGTKPQISDGVKFDNVFGRIDLNTFSANFTVNQNCILHHYEIKFELQLPVFTIFCRLT